MTGDQGASMGTKVMAAGLVVAAALLVWAGWSWDKAGDYEANHREYATLLDRMVFEGYEPETGGFAGSEPDVVLAAANQAEHQAGTFRRWAAGLTALGVGVGAGSVLLRRRATMADATR